MLSHSYSEHPHRYVPQPYQPQHFTFGLHGNSKSYLSESVKERPWQAFPPTSLSKRILTPENLCLFMLYLKTHSQLRNIDFSSVVKTSIESFQYRLRSQVELFEESIYIYYICYITIKKKE